MKAEVVAIISREIEKTFPKAAFMDLRIDVEKLTRHLDIYERSNKENEISLKSVSISLLNIESAIVPHKLNDNKGLIKDLSLAKEIIKTQGDILIAHKVYFAILGTVCLLLLSSVVPLIFKVFYHETL